MKNHLPPLLILVIVIIAGAGCSASGQSKIDRLNPTAFQQRMEQAEQRIILDVRTTEEFVGGHLPEAVNYDIYDTAFGSKLLTLDKTKPVFVYCKAGSRSLDAAEQLKALGFTTVYDLRGGIMAWERDGLPLSDGADAADRFSKADFNRLLATNERLLVDFYADWCLPCKKMEPEITRLEKKYAGKVTVVRINVDEARALSSELDIREIPVVAIYRKGKEIKRETGYQSDNALLRLIKELE